MHQFITRTQSDFVSQVLTLLTLQTLVTILSSLTFNRLIGHHQPGDLGDQVIESVETANVVMTDWRTCCFHVLKCTF